MKMTKKKAEKTVRTLIKKLDKIFSTYIRKREADNKGYVQCISCARKYEWQEMDAGHYISRRHLATRFDEQNVHAQCKKCNRFQDGNMDEYALSLQRKYGNEILKDLNRRKNETKKFTIDELEEMNSHYQSLI